MTALSMTSRSRFEKEVTAMEKLSLLAVFWEGHEAKDGEDATVHVEDGVVVYITRRDGLEVRLLITELEYVYHFALEQIHRRDEEDAQEIHESSDDTPKRIQTNGGTR